MGQLEHLNRTPRRTRDRVRARGPAWRQLLGSAALPPLAAGLLLATGCGAEREYEIAWTRALVARGLPEQAIAHYAALPAGLREADPARNAALEAHVERAGFKPLAFMTSLRGTLRATQRIYREGRVSPEQQAAAREVLARAEELTRADDAGSVLLLGGGARLICALLVTKEDPGEGAPSVLSALEYIAAARDPAVAVVAGSARATLDRIEELGEMESVDREAALLAWLEGPADE